MYVRMNLKTFLQDGTWLLSVSCMHRGGRKGATLSALSGPFLLQPVSVGTSSRHRWSVCRDFIGSNVFLCHETQVSHWSWCRSGELLLRLPLCTDTWLLSNPSMSFTDIYETTGISVPGKARIAGSWVFAYLLFLSTPRFTTLLDASI